MAAFTEHTGISRPADKIGHNEQEQNGTNDMTIFMGDESFDSMENLITRVEAIVNATIPGHSILRMEGVIVPK